MKNQFFQIAKNQAVKFLGKGGRAFVLLAQLANKLRSVNWKTVNRATIKDKFLVLGRLLKAYTTGHYREVPWRSMLVIIAAIIYFVSPIDLIPDFIPLTGLTDDFAVLLYVYNTAKNEIDKFLTWEKSRPMIIS
jgi:uncharacterized membrane protein YkvA (DUF1232 family)